MQTPMERLFFELHEGLPQQGPGSAASTARAWRALTDALGTSTVHDILDVGCGPGRQTMDLLEFSRETDARITAVDNYPPFTEQLMASVAPRVAAATDRLTVLNADMGALPFEEASFDIIWSEGAIYVLGFEAGLRAWRSFLRPRGGIALTEISWLRRDPAPEARAFWEREYPGIASVEANLETLRRIGYNPVAHFTLPEADWWTGYYTPLRENARRFAEKYRGDEVAMEILAVEEAEIDLFSRHADSYGYVFYIATV
jgi:SAM-dependent methyltransferase